jgi:hypothetical protein
MGRGNRYSFPRLMSESKLLVFAFLAVGLLPLRAQRCHGKERPKLNYDEAKVAPFDLPDPLRCADGTFITASGQWRAKRRPELIDLFSRTMYGYTPARGAPNLHWEVTSSAPALEGAALRKEVTLWFTSGRAGPSLHLLEYVPAARAGAPGRRWPAFLGLNFSGNQGVETGKEASQWPMAAITRRGYAVITAGYNELCPDREDALDKGAVGRLFAANPMNERSPTEWGAIGQWAWGLSRILDYLQADADINGRRVAVIGHSRLGKAALWAAAQDERFAAAISNESGCAGAKVSRRNYGQTIEDITIGFPHWFCRDVVNYRDPNRLPIDQHELLALVAPRPLYVGAAQDDRLSDPVGQFLALKGAEPVYALFALPGLPVSTIPAVSTPVSAGVLGFHLRPGGHDMKAYDWDQYLAFADRVGL